MKKKPTQKQNPKRSPRSLQRVVRHHACVSKIESMTFECNGAVLQYCNGFISIWTDGDTTHEADIDLDVNILNRIVKVGEEQVEDRNDA